MMMTNDDIFKQLTINSFMIPTVLQELVKGFVFYDKVEAEARRNKTGLNNQLKLGLTYFGDDVDFHHGHWGLSYRYERQLQAVNCPCCGNFHLANNQDFTTLNPSITCHCDDEYVDEIMNQVQSRSQEIDIDLDHNLVINQEIQMHEEQNDENEDQIPVIDFGIEYLLRHF
jgi:hypothetical protein